MAAASPPRPGRLAAWTHAIRPPHLAKSLLVAVPWIAHHGPFDAAHAGRVGAAFVAFSLVASGTYLLNDLADVEADRTHPARRHRPVAAGAIAPIAAGAGAALLLAAGVAVAGFLLPAAFLGPLLGYAVLATAYTFVLKRIVMLDVIVLSALYVARVLGGGAATGIPVSPWLMALASFLFLSLGMLKRYAELRRLDLPPQGPVPGRGYVGSDLDVLRAAGVVTGGLAVLVLALYVNGEQGTIEYRRPELLWLAAPALLYWILRLWTLAHRGALLDDPVVFALKDPASWAAAAWIAAAGTAAAL